VLVIPVRLPQARPPHIRHRAERRVLLSAYSGAAGGRR
jgi:hypothetical protein